MAKLLIIIILFSQVVYSTYSLKIKNENIVNKIKMRVTLISVIIILAATGLISWNFTWKLPCITLIFLLIFSLFRWRRDKFKFKKSKTVLFGFMSLVVLFISLLPAILFPINPSPEPTGNYKVLTEDITYRDVRRAETNDSSGKAREVNVTYWYPETDAGKYPLIVFDHGFNGVKLSNESTFKELASHGYIVCSMDHPYQSLFTVNSKGESTYISPSYMMEYSNIGNKDLDSDSKYLKKWIEVRIKDTNLVIENSLNSYNKILKMIDKEKVGIMGHSLGAATATSVGRQNPVINSVINIDGPMPSEIVGVDSTKNKYNILTEKYPVPIMFVYSEYLYKNGIEKYDPLYAINREVAKNAPESYEIVFKGSEHMNLTDLVFVSPILAYILNGGRKGSVDETECIKSMNGVVREYFDKTLKGQGDFNYEFTTFK